MTIERWQTPVSEARGLVMRSLLDGNGDLRIVVEDWPDGRRFEFTFHRVAGYRNVLEEYRTSELRPDGVGRTIEVVESEWLAQLRSQESLLDVISPGCRQFVITTDDDVIDILTPEEPEIRELDHPVDAAAPDG
jgi:hypothetical protein